LHKKKPDVDVIMDVLQLSQQAYPLSVFIRGLLHHYQEKGGLSRKQLEGLRAKASAVKAIPAAKLATLDAIILKKPYKERSPAPILIAAPANTNATGKMIAAILEKYPAHKRVLFYQTKFSSNTPLTAAELQELEKFFRLLV
jgi:hypothetical protein